MKKISEHLGEITVALAGVALLVTAIVLFSAPIGGFFNNIVDKELSLGNQILAGIEAPKAKITFGIGHGKGNFNFLGGEYQAFEGMTWAEWCDSEFNTEGFYVIDESEIGDVSFTRFECATAISVSKFPSGRVLPEDIITADMVYYLVQFD